MFIFQLSSPHLNFMRADRADSFGGVVIDAHRSIHMKKIPLNNTLKVNLVSQSIDFVGIEAFINSDHSTTMVLIYSSFFQPLHSFTQYFISAYRR
jgi:hypothetical protein